MNRTDYTRIAFVSSILILAFFFLKDVPFFWDGQSKATRAYWFYSHDFSQWVLPTTHNSGHPPLWPISIALSWKLFGVALWPPRLLLLLINIGVFFQLYLFVKRSFVAQVPMLLFFLICIEPTLVAQTTSLNNDMLLLFFALLGINSLLRYNWTWYSLALTGLLLTNLRGIYFVVAFALLHFILVRKDYIEGGRKLLWAYLIGLSCFAIFLTYQYQTLGWVLLTPNESYADHRDTTSLFNVLKNAAAYGKSMLEFGRFAVWIPLVLLLAAFFRSKKRMSSQSAIVFVALLAFCLVFFFGMVPFSNPIAPRYFTICYLLSGILLINVLFEANLRPLIRKISLWTVGIAFISGHFWIYPPSIAQGWDSTLAHLFYFKQEEQMLRYLEEAQLSVADIGSNVQIRTSDLFFTKPDTDYDVPFAPLDLEANTYVLFSNIENRTGDEAIQTLQENWIPVKKFSRFGVFLTLYKNPATP